MKHRYFLIVVVGIGSVACNRGENADAPAAASVAFALTPPVSAPMPVEATSANPAASAAPGGEGHARREHHAGDVEHERRGHESK